MDGLSPPSEVPRRGRCGREYSSEYVRNKDATAGFRGDIGLSGLTVDRRAGYQDQAPSARHLGGPWTRERRESGPRRHWPTAGKSWLGGVLRPPIAPVPSFGISVPVNTVLKRRETGRGPEKDHGQLACSLPPLFAQIGLKAWQENAKKSWTLTTVAPAGSHPFVQIRAGIFHANVFREASILSKRRREWVPCPTPLRLPAPVRSHS